MPISGVNPTPRTTAVYASDPALPRRPQDSLPSRLLSFGRTRLALASSYRLLLSHPALRSSGVGSQHYLSAIRSSPVSMVGGSSLCIDGRIPLCMEAMLPSNNSTPADRFPMWPALPTSEYYQPV